MLNFQSVKSETSSTSFSVNSSSFHDKQHTLIAPQVVSGENTVMPAQNTGPALSRGKPSGTLMMNLIIIMMMSLRIMTMIMTVIMTMIVLMTMIMIMTMTVI